MNLYLFSKSLSVFNSFAHGMYIRIFLYNYTCMAMFVIIIVC